MSRPAPPSRSPCQNFAPADLATEHPCHRVINPTDASPYARQLWSLKPLVSSWSVINPESTRELSEGGLEQWRQSHVPWPLQLSKYGGLYLARMSPHIAAPDFRSTPGRHAWDLSKKRGGFYAPPSRRSTAGESDDDLPDAHESTAECSPRRATTRTRSQRRRASSLQ